MAKNYIDFDKFISEKEHQYITVKVLGTEYKVAREFPAIVPVLMARQEGNINPAEQTKLIMRAAEILFGADALDEMCEKGLRAQDLVDLVKRLFAAIGGNDPEDDDSEELDDESAKHSVGGNSSKK